MTSQNHAENGFDSRLSTVRLLRTRFARHRHSISISEKEAQLLGEALLLLEEKETPGISLGGRKPKLLSIVTILGGVVSFAMPAMLIWQTSTTPAFVASAIGLLVGIAAVKLDPGYKGHWLHDVD